MHRTHTVLTRFPSMIPQLIEDLLLLPQAVSRGSAAWLLAAGCDLLLLRKIDGSARGDHRWEGSSTSQSQDGVPANHAANLVNIARSPARWPFSCCGVVVAWNGVSIGAQCDSGVPARPPPCSHIVVALRPYGCIMRSARGDDSDDVAARAAHRSCAGQHSSSRRR
jgi:hypothetical protein